MSRIVTALKYLDQFGPAPLALYGLYRFGLITGHYKRLTPAPSQHSKFDSSSITKLFSLPSREQLAQIVGKKKKDLLNEANEIVSGNMRVFGERTPLNFTHNAPLVHWTEYEINPKLISVFDIPHNDIKYLWEPARFAFVFALGRAYHLADDATYAEAFWNHFESFCKSNPANMGPHWMNGQEVAIRMLALVWAYHVFETVPSTSQERRGILFQSIYEHAQRIPPTLVYARSQNNNHLFTEAAAIYTAGLFFDHSAWRTLGWKWLNWALQNQIGGYGEYIQHSTNYHRLVLQTALFINLIKKDDWPRRTAESLGRAAHWLFSLLDSASGSTPNLGPNDGALIFPLSTSSFNDFRPTVQAAARAFLRTQMNSGEWDEMSLWFGVSPAKKTYSAKDYLTENLHGDESWAYLRASTFKSRLSHIDQLHLDLWWRGLNIAQDAGTNLYNAEPPWDNPLATSKVHNTITIDGRDQMTRAGRFLVLDWANAYTKPIIESDENILYGRKAHFTGYRRLWIQHERVVNVYKNDMWVIDDRILNRRRRPHTYRLHWLLIDGTWKLDKQDRFVRLDIETPKGNVQMKVHYPQMNNCNVSLVRAGELIYGERDVKPFEGWVSRNYGHISPALSFILEVNSPYIVTLTTEFLFQK